MAKITSLFEFNHFFELALTRLENTPWQALKLERLNAIHEQLISSLGPDQRQPFYLELRGYVNGLLRDLRDHSLSDLGLSPEILRQFLNDFKAWIDEELYDEIQERLLEFCFRLGAIEYIIEHLISESESSPGANFHSELQGLDLSQAQGWLLNNYAGVLSTDLLQKLQFIHDHAQVDHTSHSNQLKGLFVVSDGEYQTGILADLSLVALKHSKKQGADQLRIATHLVDENDILADQGHDLFAWLRSTHPGKITGHIRLEYTLSERSSVLTGSSMGFAMGVLANLSIEKLNENRPQEARIYSDVAFTGSLAKDGRVQPVNEETLRYKLETAFFSQTRIIVLPSAHRKYAETVMHELDLQYPRRQLRLLFLAHINEVSRHKEIIFIQRRRINQRIGQLLHDYANFVTVSSMVFVLVLLSGFWFGVLKSPTPKKIELRNGTLRVINDFGFELWDAGTSSNHGQIVDLNHDGFPEVLIGFDYYATAEYSGHIACFDSHGNLVWKFKTGKVVSYNEEMTEDHFNAGIGLIDDLDGDGLDEIVTMSTTSTFPMQICLLDHDGSLISEYWHAGGLNACRKAELYSGNESIELIFSGINNEFRSGILLVLDPFNMRGASPAISDSYKMDNQNMGTEIFYIRFPLTHFLSRAKYDRTFIVSINHNNNVRVKNQNYVTLPYGERSEPSVFYEFDNTMRLKTWGPGDTYFYAYKMLFPNEKPLGDKNNSLTEYLSFIEYWNGSEWTQNQSINTNYLDESPQ